MAGGYELLSHTADVGIHAWGDSLAEAFAAAALGLADVLGARAEAPGSPRPVRAEAADVEALLVDFLNELVLLHETSEVAFAAVRVTRVDDAEVEAEVDVVPLAGEPVGTPVKAATYHQLRVDRRPDGGAEVRVFLDV